MPEAPHDPDDELSGFLDANREVVVRKVQGLTVDQATAIVTPSGVTLLGVVKHLAWVERGWFQHHLLGEPPDAADMAESFCIHPGTTFDEVVSDYQRSCARSRTIVAECPSLDIRTRASHWSFGIVTLRWILLHMIRETARHAGHIDILRELTDGQTGF